MPVAEVARTDGSIRVALSHGRALTLTREPGVRPTPLYRLALWGNDGMQAGGFTGSTWGIMEAILAIEKIGAHLQTAGLPGE